MRGGRRVEADRRRDAGRMALFDVREDRRPLRCGGRLRHDPRRALPRVREQRRRQRRRQRHASGAHYATHTDRTRAERVEDRMSATIYAWPFVPSNLRLAHSGEPVEVGRTYHVKGKIIPCEDGLHGSIRLIDALGYASSSILTRCRYDGTIVHEQDKLAASERTIIWLGDIKSILHEAACVFAEGALHSSKKTDPRSRQALKKNVRRLLL